MEGLYNWIKNIVYYLIFVTMLMNLLPAGKYEKYLRLFAGCILILLVIRPVTGGLRLEDKISGIFKTLSFENEAGELKADLEGMETRRLDELVKRYEAAAAEDVERIAGEKGLLSREVSVKINRDTDSRDFGKIEQVTVYLKEQAAGEERGTIRTVEKVAIGENNSLSSKVSAPGAAAGATVQGLKREIASYYQVEERYVEIKLEDD